MMDDAPFGNYCLIHLGQSGKDARKRENRQ